MQNQMELFGGEKFYSFIVQCRGEISRYSYLHEIRGVDHATRRRL